MTPTQKRTVTLICQGAIDERTAAVALDVHRGARGGGGQGRLGGIPRKEIIEYAHERCGLNKARLNTEMALP